MNMITRAKINEWIKQVEATPVLAPILIKQITDRLLELDSENESLRAENLELSSGVKVREFERKIAELEFQIDLLKRQSGGDEIQAYEAESNLLVYNDRGQLLRFACEHSKLSESHQFARIEGSPDIQSYHFGLLPVIEYDQLLLIFSSGRTITLPVDEISPSPADNLDWSGAYQVDLRSQEELAWILPVTKMHLYDHCIQVSRFGYARKITNQYLNTFISNNNIGKGVKFNFDRILNLVFCNNNQLLTLVTKAGNCLGIDTNSLSVSLDEIMRLKVNDYVVSASVLYPGEILVAVSQNGQMYVQEYSWFSSSKSGEKSRHLLTPGIDNEGVVGAVTAGREDWLLALHEDGCLSSFKPGKVSRQGSSIGIDDNTPILCIAALGSSDNLGIGA